MKLYELSQLPFKERFKFVNDLRESNSEIPTHIKLVIDIFEETISWYQKPGNLSGPNLAVKLKDIKAELPSNFETIYGIMEDSVIEKLPSNEAKRIFNEYKEAWCELYPDFKRISDLMEIYKTNEMLIEYGKHSPPPFIHHRAIEVYKKCISFKVKLTKKVLSTLRDHPDQTDMWCHYVDYCIDKNIVKTFLKDYQKWNLKIHNLWDEIYYLKQDFFSNAGYKIRWYFEIKHCSKFLKKKADEIQKTQEQIIALLNEGKELVTKMDEVITLEYESNATEMSMYERELEMLQITDGEGAADEEYCYVYTLECKHFVFYVGIAADPKDRFEQHIRGAYSDEAHLFKSKFIQKYHNEVKQNLVFEGTRRECKKFEKEYIAQHSPLGNMTEGGEG
jgi:predicted GIY-YIG superfamily endonuclease